MSVIQPLEEILEELKAAEERWQKLLKEYQVDKKQVKKPDILYVGPKPIKNIRKPLKVREPFIPVVQVRKTTNNRGDFVSRMKVQLNILKNELSWTTCAIKKAELFNEITDTKIKIKEFKKNKKNGKYPNKN